MAYVSEDRNLLQLEMTIEEYQNCVRLFEMERTRQGDRYDVFRHLLRSCIVGEERMCRYLILAKGVDHTRGVTQYEATEFPGLIRGDTPLTIALRFENVSIALFIYNLPLKSKSLIQRNENIKITFLKSFGANFSRNWQRSASTYDADSLSLFDELKRKIKWIVLFRRIAFSFERVTEIVSDLMITIPFYTPPPSTDELQTIGIDLLDKANIGSISDHFLLWTFQMLTRLSPSELASYPLIYGSDRVSPQLSLFMNFLNDIHRWVEVLVLSDWDAKDRAKTIEFFISLADDLLQKRCFVVSIGVTFGLQSAQIAR